MLTFQEYEDLRAQVKQEAQERLERLQEIRSLELTGGLLEEANNTQKMIDTAINHCIALEKR